MIDRDSNVSRADDEALSALIDGALSDEEAGRLRRRLSSDATLAARLTALERAGETVRESYADIVDEPLPEALLDLLEQDDAAVNVVPLRGKPRPRAAWVPSAVAAGIALAIGLAIGISLDRPRVAPEGFDVAASGIIAPSGALHAALESAPSGARRDLGAGLAATPRFTFRTIDGRYCRQLSLTAEDRRTETLACRQGDAWQLEAAIFAREAPAASVGVYRPASRETAPLDAAVDALIEGAPFGAELESRVIASGWADLPE